ERGISRSRRQPRRATGEGGRATKPDAAPRGARRADMIDAFKTNGSSPPRRVHLRVPHRSHDRSNAAIAASPGRVSPACVPKIVLGAGSRYRLHDLPTAITCQPCRESWEFQQRVEALSRDSAVQHDNDMKGDA